MFLTSLIKMDGINTKLSLRLNVPTKRNFNFSMLESAPA